ncbi:MAG: NADH-quinone oxidoreductase subunit NuoE [Alphaproteobacteria bacterium]
MSASFEFEPAYLDKAKMYIARYPAGRQQSAVLPLLDLAQRQNGGTLPDGAMQAIATMLDMPYIRVVEVATFYTMVHIKPVGKYLLQCCTTTPCWLRGSSEVVDAIRQHLGIEMGETTADGLFTLTEVECLGGCVNAPIVQVNDDFYEDLDAKSIVKVLKAFQKGEVPPHGSQTGRQGSAPEGGPRVLTGTAAAKE